MKKRILSIIYFVIAFLCIFYDVLLLVITPGTFMDNLTSFTHIWSLLGALFIFFGVYRIKKGHSFWVDTKKWLKIVIVSLVTLGAVISITSLFFIFNPKIAKDTENADYLILLGGGIDKNGELPQSVLNRVEEAAKYLNKHTDVVCVVTGGTLKWLPYPEAPQIKRELVKRGVEENRILVEDQAKDTIQNFQLSCKMLAEYENVSEKEILQRDIVVVTSYFHLRRAERLATRMGFENIKGIGAKIDLVKALHSYVREIGAYIKLNLRIFLTKEPRPIA